MPKERNWIILIILVLTMVSWTPAPAATIMTRQTLIALDPGHGETDTGLISRAGIQENQITLELADMIAAELSEGFQIRLTRPPEQSGPAEKKSPEQRAAFANQNRANLFVSLHLHREKPGQAFIFYYGLAIPSEANQWQTQPLESQSASKRMAENTARHFKKLTHVRTLVYQAPVIALEGTLMPGIMIEPFSLTQVPRSEQAKKKFLQPYARTIARAIEGQFINTQN
ncbi:MAG: N-acetylmuramoyl-L-alanine amidase [Desulfobacter sp.]|nr:N-acetylmuramoyl-L-alanine amidase [Desulfobacter sp.]